MADSTRQRTLTEWVVLGLLAEVPRHGFALADLLRPGGEVGRVWSASRPLTYRAIVQLAADGMIETVRTEAGRGPNRTVHRATRAGRAVLASWVHRPVAHLRDVRTELLVKLLLLERAGRSTDALLQAQRRSFAPLLAAAGAARGDDAAARWRRVQAEAVERFLAPD